MGLLTLRIRSRSYCDNLRADPAELLPLLSLVMCFFHSWELITLWKWKGFNIEISASSPLIWETRTTDSSDSKRTSPPGHHHHGMNWIHLPKPAPPRAQPCHSERQESGWMQWWKSRLCSCRSRIGILVLNTRNLESYFNCLTIHVLIFQLEQ